MSRKLTREQLEERAETKRRLALERKELDRQARYGASIRKTYVRSRDDGIYVGGIRIAIPRPGMTDYEKNIWQRMIDQLDFKINDGGLL